MSAHAWDEEKPEQRTVNGLYAEHGTALNFEPSYAPGGVRAAVMDWLPWLRQWGVPVLAAVLLIVGFVAYLAGGDFAALYVAGGGALLAIALLVVDVLADLRRHRRRRGEG